MKILVAEDQAPSALFIRHILRRLGHEVTLASNGSDAWRLVREGRFPVVILDWIMPGLDGLQLCRKIREWDGQPYSYVILLTSKHSQQDRLAGLRAGADDFLVKPPDIDELAVRLEIARRILSVQEELQRRNQLLSELALSDELTGVNNLRRFRESLEIHHSLALRQGLPLSLVMLDVDHFKGYNDAHGHPAGDEILRLVARTLAENIRKHDEVARVGGEEFAILLPDTEVGLSIEMAERLRLLIEGRPWPLKAVTASLGVATTSAEITRPSLLVDRADRALYHAKRAGRNRVSHFLEIVEEEPPERADDRRSNPSVCH